MKQRRRNRPPGKLKSNQQQQVNAATEAHQQVIVIEPAQPQTPAAATAIRLLKPDPGWKPARP